MINLISFALPHVRPVGLTCGETDGIKKNIARSMLHSFLIRRPASKHEPQGRLLVGLIIRSCHCCNNNRARFGLHAQRRRCLSAQLRCAARPVRYRLRSRSLRSGAGNKLPQNGLLSSKSAPTFRSSNTHRSPQSRGHAALRVNSRFKLPDALHQSCPYRCVPACRHAGRKEWRVCQRHGGGNGS